LSEYPNRIGLNGRFREIWFLIRFVDWITV
jgi:hypothetical protein